MTVAPRDPHLLLLGAADAGEMRDRLAAAAARADGAGYGELGEVAEEAGASLPEASRVRAAVLARDCHTMTARLAALAERLRDGAAARGFLAERGAFLGFGDRPGRIGFLFPGQGVPVYTGPGAIGDRFPETAEPFAAGGVAEHRKDVPPELVQVAVIACSLSALRVLDLLGIRAEVGVGHSMGELTAYHWAGAVDEPVVLRIARAGETVTRHAGADGTMATVLGDGDVFARALEGTGAAVAAHNSPTQRVVSGKVDAVEATLDRARELGARVFRLRVTGAYHTPLMVDAIREFQDLVAREPMEPLRRRVISTVTGEPIGPDADLRSLMARQFCEQVRFVEAATAAARECDLLLEAGPGKMLSGLAGEFLDKPVVPLRAGAASAHGLLEAAGAAYALGAPVRLGRLVPLPQPLAHPAVR